MSDFGNFRGNDSVVEGDGNVFLGDGGVLFKIYIPASSFLSSPKVRKGLLRGHSFKSLIAGSLRLLQ